MYDERFCRMWEFYLAGSETSFRVDGHMVFQIQLAKRQDAVPLTREYILEREAELRRREPRGRRCVKRRSNAIGQRQATARQEKGRASGGPSRMKPLPDTRKRGSGGS